MNTIMFDLDGTLVDSMKMWQNLGINFLNSKNLAVTNDVIKQMSTMSLAMSSAFLKDYYNLEESADKIHQDFKDTVIYFYLNEVNAKPGAFDIVKKYSDKGANILLTTATNEEFVKPVLDKFGAYNLFNKIYTSDNVGQKKDSANYFFQILKREKISADSCLLFDDSEYALLAAKMANISTCCVKDNYSIANYDMLKQKCDFYIESFDEWQI